MMTGLTEGLLGCKGCRKLGYLVAAASTCAAANSFLSGSREHLLSVFSHCYIYYKHLAMHFTKSNTECNFTQKV